MNSQIKTQSDKVSETTDIISQISANIQHFEGTIKKQTEGVADASAAVEEMIGNINSVTLSVDKMANAFDHLASSSKTGIALLSDAILRVSRIGSSRPEISLEGHTVSRIRVNLPSL